MRSEVLDEFVFTYGSSFRIHTIDLVPFWFASNHKAWKKYPYYRYKKTSNVQIKYKTELEIMFSKQWEYKDYYFTFMIFVQCYSN